MASTTTDRRQGVNSNSAIKTPCRAATTANITLSGEQTIDGVSIVDGDRVLVKNQTAGADNGIYECDTGAWARTKDWDGTYDIKKGTLVFVHSGTANSGWWYVSTSDPITIGTTSVTIAQASTALAVISAFAQTLIDDTTGGAFVETIRGDLSELASAPADDDELLLRDTSATTVKRNTVANFIKSILDSARTFTANHIFSGNTSLSSVISFNSTGIFTANITSNQNLRLSATVGSNALTIALKGNDGNDPSATNILRIPFRNATAGTSGITYIDVTAATSLVISSGSTMGTSSGVASRVWVVGFNDGGTFRLGAINCSGSGNLYPLQSDILASSTAEGGAGGADSAGVIYTGTAVTSKPMVVLGYIESTQATAGTWATTPSKVQEWLPGMKLPGDVVQRAFLYDGAVATGTTAIPADDTIPQNTEGNQYMSLAITPTSAINKLEISSQLFVSHTSATTAIQAALFQDTTANALTVASVLATTATGVAQINLNHLMNAGTTSATTFKIRAGDTSGATLTFNGVSGARLYGALANSYLTVSEVMV